MDREHRASLAACGKIVSACILLVSSGCKPGAAENRSAASQVETSRPNAVTAAAKQEPHQPAPASGSREDLFRMAVADRCLEPLQALGARDTVVEAVLEANRTNQQTPEQILARDAEWRRSQGAEHPLIAPFLTNACAEILKASQKDHPEFVEIFVMDNKGCIVGETNRTSDYWQGDEDKWIRCFNGGVGQTFVDEVTYDHSTQAFVVQVSVPIQDEAGATIGALTASVQAKEGLTQSETAPRQRQ